MSQSLQTSRSLRGEVVVVVVGMLLLLGGHFSIGHKTNYMSNFDTCTAYGVKTSYRMLPAVASLLI